MELAIAHIIAVGLTEAAADELSFATYTRVTNWMKQWTCKNNFQASIAATAQEAIEKHLTLLAQTLVPDWLTGVEAKHFRVRIHVETTENGFFWASELDNSTGDWHDLVK